MVRTILKFIVLTAGLIIIGAILGFIGALIGGRVLGDDSFAALGLAILGLFAGYFLGIFIGIILIKKVLHQRGSLLFGVLGGIIGAAIPWFIGLVWYQDSSVLLYLPAILTPVLCLAAFYLKR